MPILVHISFDAAARGPPEFAPAKPRTPVKGEEAQALQPDADVRTGRSRSRSVSRSRSRSRDRSPPAAANRPDELARDRGAGRSAAAPGEDEDVVLDDTHDTSEAALTCPISTGLLVQPMKALPCGHVYSAASRAYFKVPGGKKCAVFGCVKVLKWSDFVKDEALNIRLHKVPEGDDTFFKVKTTTKLQKVFDAYATAKYPGRDLRFLLDGKRLNGDQTPEDVDVEDGDQIDVFEDAFSASLRAAKRPRSSPRQV